MKFGTLNYKYNIRFKKKFKGVTFFTFFSKFNLKVKSFKFEKW